MASGYFFHAEMELVIIAVLDPHSWKTWSASSLLIPWLHAPMGHQQPCYKQYKISKSMRKRLPCEKNPKTCAVSLQRNDLKCKCIFIAAACIVVCLSTSWGINNKSEVDIYLAVINDKRSSKSATSLSHSHSLTNWYTGYMHDDQ